MSSYDKDVECPIFIWNGINKKGIKVNGEQQGKAINEVKSELRRQGISITKISKKPAPLFSFNQSVTALDIALISRQIATMLNAGVPLVQSLQLIAKSNQKVNLRKLLIVLEHQVASGTPLSQSLRQFPRQFDDLYCELVEAGEKSGCLDVIYERISTYKEKSEQLKSKIKKALFYPAAVLIVALIVTMLLLILVIPQFQEIFIGFGATLPTFTLFVLNLSDLIQKYWLSILGSNTLLLLIFIKSHRSNANVRNKTDRLMLHIPIIGAILKKAAVARFARTLATTSAAGITLVDSLISAAGASGNYVYRQAVLDMRDQVIAGLPVNDAMRATGCFPDMVSQMVMIGEESGHLEGMLTKVADIYEQQVDDAVDALTSLLEPMIMVVLGIVVGGLIIAMYLPIFQLGSVVG
ncbi:type II secretion system F family protein [Psychromonas aquatilis]|uniref:Type II secretion system F family protein n=1 Tax=Psychromonas aquatilis TaxID=2005072 RepID=A0ABU9GL24_9GAMM